MRKHEAQRRVAVVAGVRTPFGVCGGAFRKLGVLELGRFVVSELIERSGVRATDVDQLVFGSTEPSSASTNLARRMALAAAMPPCIDAYGWARGCATSYQAIVSVAEAILSGTIDVGIAAAADSASSALPETANPTLADRLLALRASVPARPVV